MEDRDHDLLIVAGRDLAYLRISFDEFRGTINERANRQDKRLEEAEKQIEDLRTTRAKLYGAVATMSFLISAAMKFWKLS